MPSRSRRIEFDRQPRLPFEEWDEPDFRVDENRPAMLRNHGVGELALTKEDEAAGRASDRHLYFMSFGSGSSGNGCYVGCSKGGIIVDAGVKCEDIEMMLRANGVNMQSVKGLLLTHDHSDHVKYAYSILRKHKHIRLYCTNRVLNGMLRRHNISRRIKEYHNPIFKEIPFRILDFEITAFDVPHDGSDNMGYSITFDNRNFVLATDLGAVTERARHYMSQADYLVIEANYDLQMLLMGRYPEYLKARIQTSNGHLDNTVTAAFLKEIYNGRLKYVFLCHLSQDNNTPGKALKAVREALEERGLKVGNCRDSVLDIDTDLQLMALPRFDPSPWFVFRP